MLAAPPHPAALAEWESQAFAQHSDDGISWPGANDVSQWHHQEPNGSVFERFQQLCQQQDFSIWSQQPEDASLANFRENFMPWQAQNPGGYMSAPPFPWANPMAEKACDDGDALLSAVAALQMQLAGSVSQTTPIATAPKPKKSPGSSSGSSARIPAAAMPMRVPLGPEPFGSAEPMSLNISADGSVQASCQPGKRPSPRESSEEQPDSLASLPPPGLTFSRAACLGTEADVEPQRLDSPSGLLGANLSGASSPSPSRGSKSAPAATKAAPKGKASAKVVARSVAQPTKAVSANVGFPSMVIPPRPASPQPSVGSSTPIGSTMGDVGEEVAPGIRVSPTEVGGESCTRVEWKIDDLRGRLQASMGRPLVSPSFVAVGLPNLRLMVFPDAREAVKSARSRERKGMYAAMVKKGPLYGALKLKADCLECATVVNFFLTCGGVRRGPFTYDFSEQAIHGCDDFGVDWLKQVEDATGCLRVGVEILMSGIQDAPVGIPSGGGSLTAGASALEGLVATAEDDDANDVMYSVNTGAEQLSGPGAWLEAGLASARGSSARGNGPGGISQPRLRGC